MKNEEVLRSKKIVLGVCSSIAVYKAAELVSALVKLGAEVKVVMTENAARLMSERIFQTLSRNKVASTLWRDVEDWKPEHIALAEWGDILVVAPATANAIGNFANGLAPDLLSSLYLAFTAPVLVAPAMNCNMYARSSVQRNLTTLKSDGVNIVEPADGNLACGVSGKGRLAEIEEIINAIASVLETK